LNLVYALHSAMVKHSVAPFPRANSLYRTTLSLAILGASQVGGFPVTRQVSVPWQWHLPLLSPDPEKGTCLLTPLAPSVTAEQAKAAPL